MVRQKKENSNRYSCSERRKWQTHSSHKERKKVKSFSRVRLFVTPWTVDYQAPPSMEFSRQDYWSGLPFPSPRFFKILREKRHDFFKAIYYSVINTISILRLYFHTHINIMYSIVTLRNS